MKNSHMELLTILWMGYLCSEPIIHISYIRKLTVGVAVGQFALDGVIGVELADAANLRRFLSNGVVVLALVRRTCLQVQHMTLGHRGRW